MSWLVGAYSLRGEKLNQEWSSRFSRLGRNVLRRISKPGLVVLAGGVEDTCRYGSGSSEWIVCGVGFEERSDHYRLLSSSEWAEYMSEVRDRSALAGQFCGMQATESELILFTDSHGARDLFYAVVGNTLLFSTRIDWLARLSGNHEIDPAGFGGRWMLFYQLSDDSIVKGITRLGAGATVTVSKGAIRLTRKPWQFERTDTELQEATARMVRIEGEGVKQLTLSLSGGLDSRLLLSQLLPQKIPFDAVSFGPADHPDAIIATQLACEFGIEHHHYHEPNSSDVQSIVREHALHTMAMRPASAAIQLQYHSRLQRNGRMILDGFLGELGRRKYFNRLALFGQRALLSKNAREALPYMRLERPMPFTSEFTAVLEESARHQLQEVLSQLREPHDTPAGALVDIIAATSVIKNTSSHEQTRTDQYFMSASPFMFPSVLNAMLSAPLSSRQNGRAFRKVIAQTPKLTTLPLASVDTMIPYHLGTLTGYIMRNVKRRLGRTYSSDVRSETLKHLEPMAWELLESMDRSSGLYDRARVRAMIREYYQGNEDYAAELDWWLGFELWRSGLTAAI